MNFLPCPFCGHTSQDLLDAFHCTGTGWHDIVLKDGDLFREYLDFRDKRVQGLCWQYSCLVHEGGCGVTMYGDSEQEVKDAWNRRT